MASSFRNQDFGTVQKTIQQWLKYPVVWSGLASIGVHGVLFSLLPFLNATALRDNPPDIQRSVDLVELTPEEQQRLPDFPDEVPIDLPPLAQSPSQNPPATPQRSPSEQLIARNQELRQLYAYNPEGTSNEAFRETGTSWLLAAREELGNDWNDEVEQNLDPDNVVKLEGSYPKAACSRRPNDVMMGVLVDGDGKIVQESLPPAILQSSGYGIFNQLALEALSAHEFEAKGKTLPYYVQVTFNPSEACPAGTTPQQPEQAQEAPAS
ncbi:hypothetical protein [Leptolyngbya ohadii]|uniref:hypothetical protein n=1 Tax=Leptolyngbya ohadii TaxID=1962290 RepID=UPI000B59EBBD|nr:hypothetical protein [Leptolyngbya ohadii]